MATATRSSGNDVVPAGDPVATARNAINSVLPSTPCTWLDIAGVEGGSDGVSVALRGVAGDAAAAQQELNQALTGAGLDNARLDFGDVAPITPAGCAALDTYRQVRASSDYHLSVARPRFEMMMQPPGTPYAGEEASNAVINFNFANAEGDFAILGIEPSGTITNILPDRASFEQALTAQGSPIVDEGDGRYRLNIDLDHQGWSGIILISGRGPFDRDLVAPPIGARGPSWQNEFLSAAAAGQWRVEMVWFESVNRESGDAAPPRAAARPPTAADGQEPATSHGIGRQSSTEWLEPSQAEGPLDKLDNPVRAELAFDTRLRQAQPTESEREPSSIGLRPRTCRIEATPGSWTDGASAHGPQSRRSSGFSSNPSRSWRS